MRKYEYNHYLLNKNHKNNSDSLFVALKATNDHLHSANIYSQKISENLNIE